MLLASDIYVMVATIRREFKSDSAIQKHHLLNLFLSALNSRFPVFKTWLGF